MQRKFTSAHIFERTEMTLGFEPCGLDIDRVLAGSDDLLLQVLHLKLHLNNRLSERSQLISVT